MSGLEAEDARAEFLASLEPLREGMRLWDRTRLPGPLIDAADALLAKYPEKEK